MTDARDRWHEIAPLSMLKWGRTCGIPAKCLCRHFFRQANWQDDSTRLSRKQRQQRRWVASEMEQTPGPSTTGEVGTPAAVQPAAVEVEKVKPVQVCVWWVDVLAPGKYHEAFGRDASTALYLA